MLDAQRGEARASEQGGMQQGAVGSRECAERGIEVAQGCRTVFMGQRYSSLQFHHAAGVAGVLRIVQVLARGFHHRFRSGQIEPATLAPRCHGNDVDQPVVHQGSQTCPLSQCAIHFGQRVWRKISRCAFRVEQVEGKLRLIRCFADCRPESEYRKVGPAMGGFIGSCIGLRAW